MGYHRITIIIRHTSLILRDSINGMHQFFPFLVAVIMKVGVVARLGLDLKKIRVISLDVTGTLLIHRCIHTTR